MNDDQLYGLVVCGGRSSRMGRDKGLIEYHKMPQRIYACRMLGKICRKVFIGCTALQAAEMEAGYDVLTDDVQFENHGPLTAVLSAFKKYPDKNFFITGCDYPLLTFNDMLDFHESIPSGIIAAAFYNITEDIYEPLLGYYSSAAGIEMMKRFQNGPFSLQQFLLNVNAYRYIPNDPKHIRSIDTPDQSADILKTL